MTKKGLPDLIGPQNDQFLPENSLMDASPEEIMRFGEDTEYDPEEYLHRENDCETCVYGNICIASKANHE